ncbi:hypothetical protein CAEBREN_00369 [Caenorhabditis brenneri]|uniref:Uncharacterized protein n=1 Tax=Caenorhabditis brenneri TaxID=135651 RepID=G0N260_CAEBE|nr:hypothetical protein CAEBREN_00369 [Caenorhabditis brenneri]
MYALYAREWYSITRNIQRTLRISQPRTQEVSEISASTSEAQEAPEIQELEPDTEGSAIKKLKEQLEASRAEERRLEREIEELKRHLSSLKVQKPQEEEEPVPVDDDFELVSSKDC